MSKRIIRHVRHYRQAGISMFVVLVALLLFSLAVVALIRSVNTGALVVGNIAFKKTATALSDQAAEAAMTWLSDNASDSSLYVDQTTLGYIATNPTSLDVTGQAGGTIQVDWNANGCTDSTVSANKCVTPVTPSATDDVDGFTASYFISRLCSSAVDPASTDCVRPINASGSSSARGSLTYSEYERLATSTQPYYRIVVRTSGPRGTVSYVESLVHF